MNRLIILSAAFFLLILGLDVGSAAEISVQPGDSIQTAVDNANSGDVIILKSGTYTENIKITKDNIEINSESGNPDDTIITASNSHDNVITLEADNVKISGLGITGTKDRYAGIYLSGRNKCIIENNKIQKNGYGIYIDTSDGNTLSGNTMASNSVCGLFVSSESDNNLIYNNYFKNTVNADVKNGIGNAYNTAKTEDVNIVGGSYLGGNFWAEPDGTGFSETAVDANGDGIADSAYRLSNSIYSDQLPLIPSSRPEENGLPAANTEPENYTVNLSARNEDGSASKTAGITVGQNTENNSTGSEDGGKVTVTNESNGNVTGNNSTVGSSEPANNVETKETLQTFITDGDKVKFDFKNNASCIVNLTFDSRQTMGQTAAVVETLKEKSTLVSESPSNEIYKYFNIWVGNEGYATPMNIENPTLCFKVEKAWLQDKNINKTSITLNRYDEGTWKQLPVNLSEEDDRFLYFTAQPSEFSFFAVTGKSEAGETPTVDSKLDSHPETGTTDLKGENADAISNSDVEYALENKAKSPGFEVFYGIISLLALFLYKRVKPGN